MTVRSYLFAPADDPARIEAALASGADAVILDLEDTVAVARKALARKTAIAVLTRPRSCRLYVRVNGLAHPFAHDDFLAMVRPGLDGILVPKVENPADLATCHWLLTQLERAAGLVQGAIDLTPIIETAQGFEAIEAIARNPARARRLTFGAGDLTLDLGMRWTHAETELGAFRARFAVASRAAGLEPPVDAVWLDIDDDSGLEAATRRGLDHGFGGKFCLSPGQVKIVHRVMTPTPSEVEAARRIVSAFRQSEMEGQAAILVDGRFVDYPIAKMAERVLARAAE